MTTARPPAPPVATPDAADLESALAGVEQAVAALGESLMRPDADALETAAAELQATMRGAMDRFARAARLGTMPAELRRRFAVAAGQVTAQREALFRASSSVDQALEILIPRQAAASSVYSAPGGGQRGSGRVIAAS